MKKVISILLFVVLLSSALTIAPVAANAAKAEIYSYGILDDGTAIITKYNGAGGDVVIPSAIGGYTVTVIGGISFELSSITSVTVPDTVTKINMFAFCSCTKLSTVVIPKSVTTIERDAFKGCSSLLCFDVDGDNTEYCSVDGSLYDKSGSTLVQYATGKPEIHFTIPDTVTAIGDSAFSFCTNMNSVSIPGSVATIGVRAFEECGLVAITIPDSVESIGEYAFYNCASLTSAQISGSITEIESCTFSGCSSLTSVSIPNSVTTIGFGAFENCSSLTSVSIPDSVTTIDDSAFYDCAGLTSVMIPRTVTSIGQRSFGYYSYDYDNDGAIEVLPVDGFTIYGYADTAAEEYAKENEMTFVYLEAEPPAESKHILGDADDDGSVNIVDATVIQRHLVSLSTIAYHEELADADEDGKVTVLDATAIQRYLVGLPTNGHIGQFV